MNDWIAVEVIDRGHEALLELLFGGDTDVAQDGAGQLGEEAFDEVEPGAVLGSEGELKPAGLAARRAKLGSLWRYARNDCRGSNGSPCRPDRPCRRA